MARKKGDDGVVHSGYINNNILIDCDEKTTTMAEKWDAIIIVAAITHETETSISSFVVSQQYQNMIRKQRDNIISHRLCRIAIADHDSSFFFTVDFPPSPSPPPSFLFRLSTLNTFIPLIIASSIDYLYSLSTILCTNTPNKHANFVSTVGWAE